MTKCIGASVTASCLGFCFYVTLFIMTIIVLRYAVNEEKIAEQYWDEVLKTRTQFE